MNNTTQPLVVGLIYEVVHDSSIDYTDAEIWISEEVDFRVGAQDMKVRFDFNEGHQTVEEAIFAVQSYIDRWEFKASVEFGPGKFALRILRPILQVQASPRRCPTDICKRLAVATNRYRDDNDKGNAISYATGPWAN